MPDTFQINPFIDFLGFEICCYLQQLEFVFCLSFGCSSREAKSLLLDKTFLFDKTFVCFVSLWKIVLYNIHSLLFKKNRFLSDFSTWRTSYWACLQKINVNWVNTTCDWIHISWLNINKIRLNTYKIILNTYKMGLNKYKLTERNYL